MMVKTVQLSAEVATPKGRLPSDGLFDPRLSWILFGHVEGNRYSYRAVLRNVGDEPVGSADLNMVEFLWQFSDRRANKHGWTFPDRIEPGETFAFRWVDEEILAPGYALMFVRLWRIGGRPEVGVQDEAGETVAPDSPDYEYHPAPVPGRPTLMFARPNHAFAAFRSMSRQERKQSILIVIAVVGILLSALFGILNAMRPG